MNVKKEIKNAIRNGIYMGFENEEEEEDFMNELFAFLIKKKNFCTFKDNDKTIVVSSEVEDLGEIYIHAKTLKITPLAEQGFFKVFMDMLEFLSVRHKAELDKLKELESRKEEEDISTEEDTDSDDGEWWL